MTAPPPGSPPPYGPPPSGDLPPYGQQPSTPYGPPPPNPYPPPPPGAPYPPPAQGYYPPPAPPKKNRRGLLIAGLVVGGGFVLLLIGGIVFYLIFGKGTVTATDVAVGDCLKEIPGDARVLTVQTVDCDQPHAGEVFAVLLMPDGNYPGQSAIDEYADRCSPELASYSPTAMEDDSVQLYVLYPTRETWEQGDRAVTCIATLDPPRAGTLR